MLDRLKTKWGICWILVSACAPFYTNASDADLVKMIEDIAVRESVEPYLAVSIISHESGNPKHNFSINPYALNIKGKSYYPKSKSHSYELIHKAILDGFDSVGVGLGQVEWKYHSNSFKSYWDALDPQKNAEVTSKYLRAMISRCGGNVACGVASYHNMNRPVGEKYLALVARRCEALYGVEKCKELRNGY